MPAYFLALDLGAESGRALLGALSDDRLQLEEKHRFANPSGSIHGQLHWNLLAQWEQIKEGLRKTAGVVLDGIGVDTWGVDFGLLDARGRLLDNPVHYRDPWTEGVMERTFTAVSREEIFDATGIQFMRLNTLFQLLAMKQNRPDLLQRADRLLFMPDLFNYLLTGCKKSEQSIASTSQMLDPRSRSWAIPLLRKLDIPTSILPEIIPSGTVLGMMLEDVARQCDIKAAPIIAPGCHDTASAVAAVPADAHGSEGQDWCYISSGTWSLMGVELDRPIVTAAALEHSYTNELGVGGRVRFLKNIAGLWLVQECRRQWQTEGRQYTYGELTQMAEKAGTDALLNPDEPEFLLPGDMPGKIDRFCRRTGQRSPASHGEFVRCCLQSLALTYRRTLRGLETLLGRPLKTIHIVGGGSQNLLLNQMTADACARPVVAGPVEATAIGNVLTQAIAVGKLENLAQARALVGRSFPLQRYEPTNVQKWDDAYDRFVKIQHCLPLK